MGNAASDYTQSSSLVDLARIALRAGDAVQPLADAYASVLSHVAERREEENRRFGELLVDWIATGSTSGELMPVEQVIERVIGPLAAEVPLLLVVVDGMSMPVWREILEDLGRQGWASLVPADTPIPPGVATVPSVTRYLARQPALGEADVRGRRGRETRIRGASIARPSEQDAVSSGTFPQRRIVAAWRSSAG